MKIDLATYFATIGASGGKSRSAAKLAALKANRAKRWPKKTKRDAARGKA